MVMKLKIRNVNGITVKVGNVLDEEKSFKLA